MGLGDTLECISMCKKELDQSKDLINMLKEKIKEGTVTFVYAAKDEEHNSAAALKMFLENLKD